ncbi:MAG: 2-hydroxychromene-2-carboxylate isomerase [Magnetovibrio sp.]|nr:2-hydroxychromene-2-carboxylate isomerase [Magnetovibrio sp.]
MSPITLHYYFSIVSPWAYLGDQRFQEIAKRSQAQVIYHPLSSPDLFPATGGQLLKDRAQHRKDYRLVELARWSDHLDVALNLQPKHFPVPEAPASKLILAVQESGEGAGPLLSAILKAVWADELDVSTPETLTKLTTAAGLNGETLWAASKAPSFDQAFKDTTQAAIASGVFGYPTYVYKDELFWGQDRLDFLARAINNEG